MRISLIVAGRIAVAVLGLLAFSTVAAELDVSTCNGSCGFYGGFIHLTGTIELGDTERLGDTLDAAPPKIYPYGIALSLDGGDIMEAMRLGRWIRARGFSTFVPVEAHCRQTCLHVLAGGDGRFAYGDLTFWGGANPDASQTDEDARMASWSYFEEMGVTPMLANEIYVAAPDRLPLSDFDLLHYNLDQTDLFWVRHTAMTQIGDDSICMRMPSETTRQECMLYIAIHYQLISPPHAGNAR